MKLKGSLTISRPHGTHGRDIVRITIVDEDAGCVAVEATMSVLAFADALFSMAHNACEFRFNDSGVIGKLREHKEVQVHIRGGKDKDRAIDRAVKKHEVDGWEGSREDAENHHRLSGYTRDGSFNCLMRFERWIEKPTTESA